MLMSPLCLKCNEDLKHHNRKGIRLFLFFKGCGSAKISGLLDHKYGAFEIVHTAYGPYSPVPISVIFNYVLYGFGWWVSVLTSNCYCIDPMDY